MAMLGWALNLGFAAGASNAVTGTAAATLAAFIADASGAVTITTQRGGHYLPPGAGIVPLRERIQQLDKEITEVETALDAIEQADGGALDVEAIQAAVSTELIDLLSRQGAAAEARLQKQLEALRARRAWLMGLLLDAAAILLSAA